MRRPVHFSRLLFGFLLVCIAIPTAASDAGGRIVVITDDGAEVWTRTVSAAAAEPVGSLTAGPWRKPLPDLAIPMLGGEPVPLAALRGKVLLLNTWATWCEPCRSELPWVQRLYETHADRGLSAFAINVAERPIHVVPYAEEMGLTMPIGIYTEEMTPVLFPRSVPSLLVADRAGRVRGRWNGFDPENQPVIEQVIERALSDAEDEETEVARVRVGPGKLAIRWSRETPGRVEDVRVIETDDGTPLILVSHFNLLATYDAEGSTVEQWVSDRAAGRVRPAPGATAERPELLAFRPGSKRIVFIDGSGRDRDVVESPSPVFDATWWPDAGGEGERAVGLATLDGVIVMSRDGRVLLDPEGFGTASAVVGSSSDGGAASTLVLETSGRLRWIGPDAEIAGEIEVPDDCWGLLRLSNGRLAIVDDGVRSLVEADLLSDPGGELAVATRDGRLVVLAAEDGDVRFEADWPEIGALAVADLDHDGAVELIVGGKDAISVLGRSSAAGG